MKFVYFCILFLSASLCLAQETEKGRYFKKEKEVSYNLPKYEEIKDQLPRPILENNKEWVELYWKAWEIAFSKLQSPPLSSPFVSNWIDEGLSPQIFQWDTSLIMMFGRYAYHIFPFIESHDNFYIGQHKDGMICRVINESDGQDHPWGLGEGFSRTINPPLFSWAEYEYYKFSKDKRRLEKIYEALEMYISWVTSNRECYGTPHSLYWSNGLASGMDNTPRDIGRKKVEGDIHSSNSLMGWVDMSAQIKLYYEFLSLISTELNRSEKSITYRKLAQEIGDEINKHMWDDKSGFYYDVDEFGEKSKWITVAGFWPLLAGVSTRDQNFKLVEKITDPDLFWRQMPLPSLAANQQYYDRTGNYWKGGVWAPTTYMVVKGLEYNGYHELAREIVKKNLRAFDIIYKSTGTIWETYSPDIYMPATDVSGSQLVKPNFVGWSGLIPISTLIENILGFSVNGITNTINWDLNRSDNHGIENLRFGEISTSLYYDKGTIRVISNGKFTLVIKNKNYEIQKGETIINIS